MTFQKKNSVILFIRQVTLDKLFNPTVLQFPCLENGDSIIFFIRVVVKHNLIFIKFLEQCQFSLGSFYYLFKSMLSTEHSIQYLLTKYRLTWHCAINFDCGIEQKNDLPEKKLTNSEHISRSNSSKLSKMCSKDRSPYIY